jgi:sigma-B regulation protein RsbU (phosphoserine phosphatase)
MIPRVRELSRRVGKVGTVFFISLVLFSLSVLAGWGGVGFFSFLVLAPTGVIVTYRGIRWARRHTLWSVRNRLLFVYGLFGVLPVLLLFVLVGLGGWAFMNEMALSLAGSALDRRLESMNDAVEALRREPVENRRYSAPGILQGFGHYFPGMMIYMRDSSGNHNYPPDAPPLTIPPGWNNVDGLLVYKSHFYSWAHFRDSTQEITVLAPLSDSMVENLVPHLGLISLYEATESDSAQGDAAFVGSLSVKTQAKRPGDSDMQFGLNGDPVDSKVDNASYLPPAANRLDIPVFIPSTLPHYHLNSPGKTFEGVLQVRSRPSAVLRSFFRGPELVRGILFDIVLAVAGLFLLFEVVAVIIGVSLSRRITGSVSQLYEGTRRVIRGDFGHRIPVSSSDQLGELSQSFNQMTGNLERLLVVEKEKERLQTEIEIASEVQAQLYPKEAPPKDGLKLTVRCDPARMVSGDYYDYLEIGKGKMAFAVGDVAGKGISAALLMATLQAALRAQLTHALPMQYDDCSAQPEVSSALVVSTLNKQIYAHTAPEKYATFFFAVFDEPTRTLTYTNAGHLSPLLIRNGDVTPLDSNGTVVGAFPFAKYNESCIAMKPGDLLLCYTDGITEPENAYGEEFGEARLIALVKQHAHRDDHEIVSIVLDTVRAWNGSPELHDDMTLLLAREVEPA